MARHGRNGQLPERQARFVKEYLIDLNAAQASIRAGYSPKDANVTGSKLLANPNIQAEIEKIKKKIEDKLDISVERTLQEIARIAYANIEDLVVHDNGDITPHLTNATRAQMAAISEFTVDSTGGSGDGERKLVMRTRLKLHSKTEALKMLGQYHKLFIDRIEVSATDEMLAALAEGRKRAAEMRSGEVVECKQLNSAE